VKFIDDPDPRSTRSNTRPKSSLCALVLLLLLGPLAAAGDWTAGSSDSISAAGFSVPVASYTLHQYRVTYTLKDEANPP